MEGIFLRPPHPSGNSNKASHISLNVGVLQNTPLSRKFQSLLWGDYGEFLDMHIVTNDIVLVYLQSGINKLSRQAHKKGQNKQCQPCTYDKIYVRLTSSSSPVFSRSNVLVLTLLNTSSRASQFRKSSLTPEKRVWSSH